MRSPPTGSEPSNTATASVNAAPAPFASETWAWTAAVASGDEVAFERFFAAWFDRTVALARSISRRDQSFCLDVAQDTMLRVVQSVPSFADEASVAGWMARTVLHVVIDHWRRDQRRTHRERRAAADESFTTDLAVELEHTEQLEWLRARIAELPEIERRLLAERFTNDLTLAEIGAALGMTEFAVHGRIRRIVSRLSAAARAFRTADD